MKITSEYKQRLMNPAYKTRADYLVERDRIERVARAERGLLRLCSIHARMKLSGKRILLANEIERKLNKFILL